MPARPRVLVTVADWLGDELCSLMSDTFDTVLLERDFDVTNQLSCYQALDRLRPAFVIHNVSDDRINACQLYPGWAYRHYVMGTRNIIKACSRVGARIVFLSTPHVFSGSKAVPYVEEDMPDPVNVLGQTKFWAERMIVNTRPDSLVIRSSWLYGHGHASFFTDINTRLKDGRFIIQVADQVLAPTYVRDYVNKLKELLELRACGIYHLVNSGTCTAYELARAYLTFLGAGEVPVYPVSREERPELYPIPASLALASSQLPTLQVDPMRPWQMALTLFLQKEGHLLN